MHYTTGGRYNHHVKQRRANATVNVPITPSVTLIMTMRTRRTGGERSEQPARAAEPRAVNSQEVRRKGCTFFSRGADRGGNVSRPRGQRQQTEGATSADRGGNVSRPHPSDRTPQTAPLRPHPSDRTPQTAPLRPRPSDRTPQKIAFLPPPRI